MSHSYTHTDVASSLQKLIYSTCVNTHTPFRHPAALQKVNCKSKFTFLTNSNRFDWLNRKAAGCGWLWTLAPLFCRQVSASFCIHINFSCHSTILLSRWLCRIAIAVVVAIAAAVIAACHFSISQIGSVVALTLTKCCWQNIVVARVTHVVSLLDIFVYVCMWWNCAVSTVISYIDVILPAVLTHPWSNCPVVSPSSNFPYMYICIWMFVWLLIYMFRCFYCLSCKLWHFVFLSLPSIITPPRLLLLLSLPQSTSRPYGHSSIYACRA